MKVHEKYYHYQVEVTLFDGRIFETTVVSASKKMTRDMLIRDNFKLKDGVIILNHLGVDLEFELKEVVDIQINLISTSDSKKKEVESGNKKPLLTSFLGSDILSARKALGINQKDFSKAIGISIKKLSAYERNLEIIPVEISEKVNSYLEENLQSLEVKDGDNLQEKEVIESALSKDDEMFNEFLQSEEIKELKSDLPIAKEKKSFFEKKRKEKIKKGDFEKEKERKPKTSNKKLVKTLFWLGFVSVIGFGVYGASGMVHYDASLKNVNRSIGKLVSKTEKKKEVTFENLDGGKQFAKEFLIDFYTWNIDKGGTEERSKRLSNYLNSSLDEQGGLTFDNQSKNSKVVSADVIHVDLKKDNVMDVSIKLVVLPYRNETGENEKDELLDDETVNTIEKQDNQKNSEKNTKKNLVEVTDKRFTTYLKVEVSHFKDGFEITSLPVLESVPRKSNQNKQIKIKDYGMTEDNPKVLKEVQEFLATFFKVYTSGTNNELQYYLKMDKPFEVIQGNYDYSSIVESQVYRKDKSYSVVSVIEYIDKNTNTKLRLNYHMILEKNDGRLVMTNMLDEGKE